VGAQKFMSGLTLVLFVVGLVLLIVGAELLVRGASRLAAAVGISPLVIGLTVVAFGTSAPELAVSVQSAWQGQADIAIGNVVGSNIANILLILGISALITPLVVASQLVRLDVPLMVGVSFLLYIMSWNGYLGFGEGALLFAGILLYTGWLIFQSRRENSRVAAEFAEEYGADEASKEATRTPLGLLLNFGLLVVGLILLVLGARWLVDGAVTLARWFNVSELIIGLTVVAIGTSLPEVATSVIAALRGERDIAVGNVVGSNLFNILSVLGMTALVAPTGVQVSAAALAFDLPVMIAVAVACLPIFYTGNLIARWEGLLFLGYYIAYVVYLIFAATTHDALPIFSTAMTLFVLPLTALGLFVALGREWRARRNGTADVANSAIG
jgi:cation:H+ antiporter